MGHFIKYCSVCKKIIAQCRCMSCDKVKLYDICDECKKKSNPENKTKEAIIEMFSGVSDYAERHNLLLRLQDIHKDLIINCQYPKSETDKLVEK
jgi:hypothetical protein